MDLNKLLAELESPILITGHVNPDADVISTAFSLIYYLTNELDKKAFFIYKGVIPDNLLWAIDEDFVAIEGSDYNSLIVVDTTESDLRIGFKKRDVKTLVIDHHESSFGLKDTDKTKYVTKAAPSTSSILLDFGIDYYLIYLGLFYDSFGRNTNIREAASVLLKLDITEEEIERIHSNLRKKSDPKVIEVIKNSYSINYVIDNFVLTQVIYDGEHKYYFDLLEFYSKFCDILVVYHTPSGFVNIKTFEPIFNIAEFCKKFGGGGHSLSGGIIVADEDSFYHIIDSILKELNAEPKDAI